MNTKIIKLIEKFHVLISENKKTPTTTEFIIILNDGKIISGIVTNFNVNYSVESNLFTGKIVLQNISDIPQEINLAEITDIKLIDEA